MNQTFPDFGFEEMVSGEGVNIVMVALNAWKNAGEGQIALMFAVGALPILIMAIIYIRTRKIMSATYAMLISTIILHIFGYLPPQVGWVLYSISAAMIALSLTALTGRK